MTDTKLKLKGFESLRASLCFVELENCYRSSPSFKKSEDITAIFLVVRKIAAM